MDGLDDQSIQPIESLISDSTSHQSACMCVRAREISLTL